MLIASLPSLQASVLAINPSGRLVALAGRKGLAALDLEAPLEPRRRLHRDSPMDVASIAWNTHSSHPMYLASSEAHNVLVWDIAGSRTPSQALRTILPAHSRAVTHIDWSPFEPTILATSSQDSSIHLWDIRQRGRAVKSFNTWTAGTTMVTWNQHNSLTLASSHDREVRVWDIRKPKSPTVFIAAHMSKVNSLDWSPTREHDLVTCSQDKQIKLWAITSPHEPRARAQTNAPVWRARFAPHGNAVFTISQKTARVDFSISMWHLQGEATAPVHSFEGNEDIVRDFGFRRCGLDDYQLLSWGKDQTLRLWQIPHSASAVCGHSPPVEPAPLPSQQAWGMRPEEEPAAPSPPPSPPLAADTTTPSEPTQQTESDVEASPTRFPATPGSQRRLSITIESPLPLLSHGLSVPTLTLVQEFALIKRSTLPGLTIMNVDVPSRTCLCDIAVGSNDHICLLITFPALYPFNAAPMFEFRANTTVSNTITASLRQTLVDQANSFAEQSRSCLEQLLYTAVVSANQFVAEEELVPSASAASVNEVISAPQIAPGDACILSPRLAGASFCGNGVLVLFNAFSSSPFVSALSAVVASEGAPWPPTHAEWLRRHTDVTQALSRRPFSRSPALESQKSPSHGSKKPMLPSLPALSELAFLPDDVEDSPRQSRNPPPALHEVSLRQSRSCSVDSADSTGSSLVHSSSASRQPNPFVVLVDASRFMPANRELAEMYQFPSHQLPAREACELNAESARSVGRGDLVRIWDLAAQLCDHRVAAALPSKMGFRWSETALGRATVESMLAHYEKIGDVQTLAMLSCVFTWRAVSVPARDSDEPPVIPQPPVPVIETPDERPSSTQAWLAPALERAFASGASSEASEPDSGTSVLAQLGGTPSSATRSKAGKVDSVEDAPPPHHRSLMRRSDSDVKLRRTASAAEKKRTLTLVSGSSMPEHLTERTVTPLTDSVDEDEGVMAEESRKLQLLDPSKSGLYVLYRAVYADMLMRWGLPHKRVLLLKFSHNGEEWKKGVGFDARYTMTLARLFGQTPSTNPTPNTLLDVDGAIVELHNRKLQRVRLLGEGAFSYVYAVRDLAKDKDKKEYALKVIPLRGKEDVPGFRRELKHLKAVTRHPHIIRLSDAAVSRSNGFHAFLLTENCSGGSLIDYLNRHSTNGLSTDELLDIFAQICDAVGYMHSKDIIHRDLKIENVLRAASGVWKLCDFGSCTTQVMQPKGAAQIAECEADIQSNTTMAYRAPEMVDLYSGHEIGPKSDVWALGCLLYKLCFFVTPFERGGNVNPLSILNVKLTIPDTPRYSADVTSLIVWLLEPDPATRPSIWDVIIRLSSLTSHRFISKKPLVFPEPQPAEDEEAIVASGAAILLAAMTEAADKEEHHRGHLRTQSEGGGRAKIKLKSDGKRKEEGEDWAVGAWGDKSTPPPPQDKLGFDDDFGATFPPAVPPASGQQQEPPAAAAPFSPSWDEEGAFSPRLRRNSLPSQPSLQATPVSDLPRHTHSTVLSSVTTADIEWLLGTSHGRPRWQDAPAAASLLVKRIMRKSNASYIRRLVLLTWLQRNGDAVLGALLDQPAATDGDICLTLFSILHVLVLEGHPVVLHAVAERSRFLRHLFKIWAASESSRAPCLSAYASALAHKAFFHHLFPEFEGTYSLDAWLATRASTGVATDTPFSPEAIESGSMLLSAFLSTGTLLLESARTGDELSSFAAGLIAQEVAAAQNAFLHCLSKLTGEKKSDLIHQLHPAVLGYVTAVTAVPGVGSSLAVNALTLPQSPDSPIRSSLSIQPAAMRTVVGMLRGTLVIEMHDEIDADASNGWSEQIPPLPGFPTASPISRPSAAAVHRGDIPVYPVAMVFPEGLSGEGAKLSGPHSELAVLSDASPSSSGDDAAVAALERRGHRSLSTEEPLLAGDDLNKPVASDEHRPMHVAERSDADPSSDDHAQASALHCRSTPALLGTWPAGSRNRSHSMGSSSEEDREVLKTHSGHGPRTPILPAPPARTRRVRSSPKPTRMSSEDKDEAGLAFDPFA